MKYIKKFENDKYKSDEDIESEFDNYVITNFSVDNIREDDVASGYIELYLPVKNVYYGDRWIRYENGNISFDNWYPEKLNKRFKKIIKKAIKEAKLKINVDKYNL